jgi:hypothetical protein
MIYNFNTDFVYYDIIKNHSKYKDYFYSEIISQNKPKPNAEYYHKYKCTTSYYDVINGKSDGIYYLEFAKQVIYPHLDILFSTMNLKLPTLSEITSIWYCNYDDGGYHSMHIHQCSNISGIYLLHLEGKNTTVFYNHNMNRIFHEEMSTENLPEGTLFMFPSHLQHEVLPSDGKKIAIAFNINCHFNDHTVCDS